MRTQIIKVTLLTLSFKAGAVLAIDLSAYEKQCAEIGFKRKTPAFGECVLELSDRAGASSSRATAVVNSAEDQTCLRYGFKVNTQAFAECKFKLDQAKQEGLRAEQQYAREKAAYDQQVAAIEKEREKARAMKQLELGLRMMGGQSPVNAVNSLGTGAPIAPSRPSPINQTITMPNGRMINCTTIGSNTNCF